MTVKHGPDRAEIVGEGARVPIGVDVRIAAQVKDDVVVGVDVGKLAMHAGQQVHLLGRELNEGIVIRVQLNGQVFQLRNFKQLLRLGGRFGRGRNQRVTFKQRNDVGGNLTVNQIVVQELVRGGRGFKIYVFGKMPRP